MELKAFATIFITVFLAELGDKTQLATMLFAADKEISKWLVFGAAAGALVVSAALGVLIGSAVTQIIDTKLLNQLAGAGFIAIGAWTLYSA